MRYLFKLLYLLQQRLQKKEHWLTQSNIKETILMDQHLYVYCLWNGDCNGAAIVLYTFAEVLIKFIWIPNIPMPVVSRIRLVLVKFKNSANLPFSYKRCWFDLARNGRNGVDCFYKSQIRRIWPPSTRCPAERFQNTSQIETETQSLDIRHYRGDKRTGGDSQSCDTTVTTSHPGVTSSVQSLFLQTIITTLTLGYWAYIR